MRRWSLGWALAVCAIAAAGCGGGSKSSTPQGGAAKGLKGQYYYLAVTPPTGGSIASSDGAIACQPSGAGCGDSVYHQTKFTWGTQVTLTATAAQGYVFQSWSGDCSGTTCTIGTTDATEYAVSAVFSPAAPLPATTVGRVYGYVKDGGVGVAGVKLTLGTFSATTNANGAYVFEIAPGSYTLQTASSAQYAASAGVAVTVPIPDGVADPAGSCYLGGAKQGYWVPTAGQAGAGCLVRQADIAVARASTYVAPATPPTIATTPAMPAVVGFGATVTVGCGVGGTVTQVGTTPAALTLSAPDANGNVSFTTAALSDPAVTAILASTTDGRPGIVSINQSQAAALAYTLSCTLNGAKATVKVPMVAAVNANIATALRGEPFKMAAYYAAANGLPGITGPLWAAGAETSDNNQYNPSGDGKTFTNPDGSTWRAHDAVVVPPGVVMVIDGVAAGTNWRFCGKASDTYATCTDPTTLATPITPPTIQGNGTAAAWFFAAGFTGKSLYLTSDVALSANNTTAEAVIPIQPKFWGSWDQRSTAGVESCAGCHTAPGELLTNQADIAPLVASGACVAGQPCYELGPTEPVTGWLESKHSKAIIDGASNTHFSLQACGACHTTGYDPNLPGNKGFSDLLGSYTNDFLFEGSDSTLFLADLAAKNAPAAALVNVQCTSCHGPTPSNPNHTASMSSKICGTCHNGHDPQYEQWLSTAAIDPATSQPKHGHANLADAQNEGPNHGRDQTHCGRCHFAQGYMLYSQALVSGNPDKLGNAAPVGAPSTAMVTPLLCAPATTDATKDACLTTQTAGLVTSQNIDAITCQTCHDPHSLEVRIKDADTANGMLLAGGFKIYNAGSGALCSSCHNSRNGIVGAVAPNLNAKTASTSGTPMQHNDATPLTSNTTNNFGGLGGPHDAAQADVYYAGNGYLLCNAGTASGACPLPSTPNPHASATYFADTCAECHVKRLSTATKGAPSNHTFAVDEGTCQNCHGTGVTYIASRQLIVNRLMGEYLVSLANVLKGAGIAVVNGKLGAATTAADYTVTSTISSVAVSGGRPITLDITFSNGDVVMGCGVDKIFADSAKTIPVLFSTSGADKVFGKVAKSMYDYQLITNDRSFGVHNIPFVDGMLKAMVNNLESPGLPK